MTGSDLAPEEAVPGDAAFVEAEWEEPIWSAPEAPLEEAPAPQSEGEAVARYLTDEEQKDEQKVSAVSRI